MSPLAVSPLGEELLDDPAADPGLVRESLHHISRANRWFGGWWAVRAGLARLLDGHAPGRLTLLDVGTGAGDLPLAAARWARGRGIDLVPLGVERHPAAAALARAHGVPTVVACGSELPVAPRSVDVVLLSQLVHHLSADAAVALFRAVSGLARVGVVVADLRRSAATPWLFRVGATLLRFDAVTVADGVTSLRRGFTAASLRELTDRAGARATIFASPGSRLVAVWRTGDA